MLLSHDRVCGCKAIKRDDKRPKLNQNSFLCVICSFFSVHAAYKLGGNIDSIPYATLASNFFFTFLASAPINSCGHRLKDNQNVYGNMIYGKRNKLEKQKANIYKGTIAHYGCDAACNNNFMDLPTSGNHWALEELARQIV